MNRWTVTHSLLFSWSSGLGERSTELWASLLAHAIADRAEDVVATCCDWFGVELEVVN